jgi:hypothetical protein
MVGQSLGTRHRRRVCGTTVVGCARVLEVRDGPLPLLVERLEYLVYIPPPRWII